MAIYDHKYGDLSYYRVFRAWGGKEYQEYVRIRKSKQAAYAKAKKIDERLAKQQQAFCIKQAKSSEYHIRKEGGVRGLRRITVHRKGRSPADVFELRINVPWDKDIKRTTISVAVHGEAKAFEQAIDRICEWYELDADSDARAAMMAQFPAYSEAGQRDVAQVAELAIQKAKDEFEHLRQGLVNSFKRFTA